MLGLNVYIEFVFDLISPLYEIGGLTCPYIIFWLLLLIVGWKVNP
jgi:hypothetical protein